MFSSCEGSNTANVYDSQSELCKAENRGRLVTTEVLFTGLGVTVAYFFDYGMSFIDGPFAWRFPIACQIIFAVIIAILIFGLPETPRWLIQQGRVDEAVEVMCKVFNAPSTDSFIVSERDAILDTVSIENASPFKWSKLFHRDPLQTGWRLFLACLVLFMNQVSLIQVSVIPNLVQRVLMTI